MAGETDLSPRSVLMAIIAVSRSNAAAFGELDGKAGDGDLGVTLRQAVDGLERRLDHLGRLIPADLVREASQLLGTGAAATFTTLIRIGGRQAASALASRVAWESVDGSDVAATLELALKAITERGGAHLGDKTLLDALGPAAVAARQASLAGNGPAEVIRRSARAARAGAEATSSMLAAAGRASWMAERAAGFADPGALIIATWLEAIADAVAVG